MSIRIPETPYGRGPYADPLFFLLRTTFCEGLRPLAAKNALRINIKDSRKKYLGLIRDSLAVLTLCASTCFGLGFSCLQIGF